MPLPLHTPWAVWQRRAKNAQITRPTGPSGQGVAGAQGLATPSLASAATCRLRAKPDVTVPERGLPIRRTGYGCGNLRVPRYCAATKDRLPANGS